MPDQARELYTEVLALAGNGIKELLKIPFTEKTFEANISDYDPEFNGRIDFWGKTKDLVVLIDFKRSNSSIPTKKEVEEFKKIQLSFYLARMLSAKEIPNIVMGYMDLSDLSKSLFFSNTEEAQGLFQEMNFLEGVKVNQINSLDDFKNEYITVEKELIETIQSDQIYQANPQSDASCTYCLMANICPRESLGEKDES